MIKAISTKYKGYNFRSRLEARWAVFFETCGLKWKYEDQGYNIRGTWYLPDFVIENKMFLEIKPETNHEGRELCGWLAVESKMPVLHISGQPYRGEYEGRLLGVCEDFEFESCEFAGCRRCNGIYLASPLMTEDCQGYVYRWAWNIKCEPGCTADEADRPPHPSYGKISAAYDAARNERFGVFE